MLSIVSTLISSLFRYMVPTSLIKNRLFSEISSRIICSMTSLLILSSLLTSLILGLCAGAAFYLMEQGFSLWVIIGTIIAIKFILILICASVLKCNLKKIQAIACNSNEEEKTTSFSSIAHSFMSGFHSKD